MLRFILRHQRIVDGVELESFSTVDADVPGLQNALRPYRHGPSVDREYITVAGVEILPEPRADLETLRKAFSGEEGA